MLTRQRQALRVIAGAIGGAGEQRAPRPTVRRSPTYPLPGYVRVVVPTVGQRQGSSTLIIVGEHFPYVFKPGLRARTRRRWIRLCARSRSAPRARRAAGA